MQSFATGGLAAWAVQFLKRSHDMTHQDATLWSGGIVAGAGLVGIPLGSVIADVVSHRILGKGPKRRQETVLSRTLDKLDAVNRQTIQLPE